MISPQPPNAQPKPLSEMTDEQMFAHLQRLEAQLERPPNLDEVVEREEREETERKQKLWGNVANIVKNTLVPRKLHVHSWLLSGSTRAGKSVSLWACADLYSNLGFKIIAFDLPSMEGSDVCEPGFFSLPMEKLQHPLLEATKKIHGQLQTRNVKILRPVVFAEGGPVGLGVWDVHDSIPPNIVPFTLGLVSLEMRDWATLLGGADLSHYAYELLRLSIREMTEESGLQDLINVVVERAQQLGIYLVPELLPKGTEPIKLMARNADRRSLQKVFTGLRALLDSGLVMPSKINGEPVKTNLDIRKILDCKEWVSFNFSPAIPTHITFAIMRHVLRRLMDYEKDIAICIDEISQFAPRTLPEGREWYVAPMRDLIRILGIQHAKSGRVLLAATQLPDRLDEDLLQSFKFRCLFASDPADLEARIKASRVSNANELASNLGLLMNESKHCFVFLPPGVDKGWAVRGDFIPSFATHSTDQGDYDAVYQKLYGREGMVSVYPTVQYVISIIERVQSRVIAEKKKLQAEEAGGNEKLPRSLFATVQALVRLTPPGSSKQFEVLQKDFVDLVMRTGFAKSVVLENVRRLGLQQVLWIDRSKPRKTRMVVFPDKLSALSRELELDRGPGPVETEAPSAGTP